ncbi:MAG: hypothetical protein JW779_12795, partial [Candidatus Thorarchaeota archaeon]|nr:hypothetical protein [Candidatus Thorarchaeota archaeon]
MDEEDDDILELSVHNDPNARKLCDTINIESPERITNEVMDDLLQLQEERLQQLEILQERGNELPQLMIESSSEIQSQPTTNKKRGRKPKQTETADTQPQPPALPIPTRSSGRSNKGKRTNPTFSEEYGFSAQNSFRVQGCSAVIWNEDTQEEAAPFKEKNRDHERPIDIPKNYGEAMRSYDKDCWVEAMEDEVKSLISNQTWDLVDLPKGRKVNVLPCMWVYTYKRESQLFKARLVAGGHRQIEGIDYKNTFAPVARYETIRLLLALKATMSMHIAQFDIKTAFLHAD